MIDILCIAFGGFFGAISRYFVGSLPKKLGIQSSIPIGTLSVNLIGSFFLGFLIGSGIEGSLYSLLGIAFLGAFTTFSTLNVEAARLFLEKKYTTASLYLLFSYLFGVILALAGVYLGLN
ncbi:fluoride efflux transporter FluC [Cytobacillus sp. FJAT-54145]|uniref:Fluoride-specific ion channel FluC n=1 Tax=Cytobacillus spartinae TaxID=3299023 RepID=A0ABW6K5R1_9BACI